MGGGADEGCGQEGGGGPAAEEVYGFIIVVWGVGVGHGVCKQYKCVGSRILDADEGLRLGVLVHDDDRIWRCGVDEWSSMTQRLCGGGGGVGRCRVQNEDDQRIRESKK